MHGTNVKKKNGPSVDHTEKGSVKTELLRTRGQKNERHTKGDRNRGRKWAHSEIRNHVPSVT